MTLEDVKSKIAKLLTWKEGQEAVGAMHLAEQAAEKIAALMLQYNLELADVKGADQKKAVMKTWTWEFMKLTSPGLYLADFGSCIAKSNFCGCYFQNDKTELVIYGQDFEVEVCVYLIESLLGQVRRAGLAEYRKQYNDCKKNYFEALGRELSDKEISEQIGWINTFQRNYVLGAGQAIKNRLYKDLKKAEETNSNVTGLMVVKQNQLQKYAEENLNLRSTRTATSRTEHGYKEGVEKGKTVSMNRAVSGNGVTITKQLN